MIVLSNRFISRRLISGVHVSFMSMLSIAFTKWKGGGGRGGRLRPLPSPGNAKKAQSE